MKLENCWCDRKGRFVSGVTGECRCGYHLFALPEPIHDTKEVKVFWVKEQGGYVSIEV